MSKVEERDAVSFYKPLARQMNAARMKMDQAEYTKKLLEFKSGKFEHAIFLNKKWVTLQDKVYTLNYWKYFIIELIIKLSQLFLSLINNKIKKVNMKQFI